MTPAAAMTETIPGHVPADRVIAFDYLRDPRLTHDPFGAFAQLQAHPRDIVWTRANGGHWIALRRDTILAILQRPDLFSSAHINIPPMKYRAIRLVPEELDPPEHGKYRALLNPLLSPAFVGNLEVNARQVARALVDAVQPLGKADLMQAVTVPLPCSIFMTLLGLGQERMPDFLHWKDEFLFSNDPQRTQAAIDNIARTIEALSALRRREPKDDMMSVLVAAEVDGRPLDREEILSMGFLLFLAGLDTVTSAMTSCLAYVAQNPDLRDRLVADPALIREAVEEILRRHSVVNLVRTATQDFEWEGLQIKDGEQFLVATILANLDETANPDALQVDVERSPNPHLGFGAGPHRCVGSHLARIEMRVVMEEVLARLTNLRLDPSATLHYHSANLVGLSSLPVVWDAA